MDVQEFLKGNGVAFESIKHEEAYTAQEVAAAEHISGHKFAKTVIVKGGDEVFMLVLPASRHVDFKKAADVVGTKVKMVSEEQMEEIFTDCDIGAEAPFGSQYGVKTFVDESLREADEISFRAGTHDKGIKMSYADYEALEKPVTGSFSVQEG